MKDKLSQIINHYGIMSQLKYIHSEYFELDEAIVKEQNLPDGIYKQIKEAYKLHIAGEIADIMVMLKQFQYYYDIENKQIEDIMNFKIDRQLERIKKENG